MTTFEDREKAFEAKYRLDQETDFKVHIRRDKLLGLWAAGHLGLSGDAAKAYALSVVDAEFTEPDHDTCHKVMRDFAERGIGIHEDEIRREALRLQQVAREQVINETTR